MLHCLMMFLAPAAAVPQATTNSPPATLAPARRPLAHRSLSWKLAFSVLGNAVGFLALLGGCWLALQVIQALLP
jgi:hypothetical protein